jgi:hypothetical protein
MIRERKSRDTGFGSYVPCFVKPSLFDTVLRSRASKRVSEDMACTVSTASGSVKILEPCAALWHRQARFRDVQAVDPGSIV